MPDPSTPANEAAVETAARAIAEQGWSLTIHNLAEGSIHRVPAQVDDWHCNAARAALTAVRYAEMLAVVAAVKAERLAKDSLNHAGSMGWPMKRPTEEWYQATLAVTAALATLKGLEGEG